MNEPAAKLRGFAQRLIAHETLGHNPSNVPAGFLVCEKLRRHLVTLMGVTGVRSLLARALTLAKSEAPSLGPLRLKADGSFEPPEPTAELDPQEIANASLVLTCQLLGLLMTFIGEPLTLRLVHDVWPDVSFNDLNPGTKKNEQKEESA